MLYVYVFIYVSGCTCKCLYSGFFVSNRVYVFACVFECGFGWKKIRSNIFFVNFIFINHFLANFLNRILLLKRFLAASLDIGIFWSKIFLVAKSFSSEKVWMKQFFVRKFFFVEKFFCRKFILLQNHFLGKRLEEKSLYVKNCFSQNLFVKFFCCKNSIISSETA